MAPGSQPGDYTNDASTTQTTSDKKNSGPSDHSQAYIDLSMRHEGPNLMMYPDRASGDEHLPDTQQGDSSWESSQHNTPLTGIHEYAQSQPNGSQAYPRPTQPRSQPPVPPFNASPQRPATSHTHHGSQIDEKHPPHPELQVDEVYINKLHVELVSRTSGCSVEQLEQVNTNLMDCIWRTRGEWNRATVVNDLKDVFNEVMVDMESLQGFSSPSQSTKNQLNWT